MRFFVDRCFPVKLCAALTALHEGVHLIEYHDNYFQQTTPDVEWIRAVGKWQPVPVILSGDTRILKRRDEVRELVAQNLMFVCLAPGWPELAFDEYTWRFFKAWPGIRDAVQRCKEPSALVVANGGSLKTEVQNLVRNLGAK